MLLTSSDDAMLRAKLVAKCALRLQQLLAPLRRQARDYSSGRGAPVDVSIAPTSHTTR